MDVSNMVLILDSDDQLNRLNYTK
uniref:Uncharacterized protein n=1 Tax=Tetranychus urticae TaxID=32264 RepID=T1KUU0_TETUR